MHAQDPYSYIPFSNSFKRSISAQLYTIVMNTHIIMLHTLLQMVNFLILFMYFYDLLIQASKYDSEGTSRQENRQHVSKNAESESVLNNLPPEGMKINIKIRQ